MTGDNNLETPEFTNYFHYSITDEKLTGFSAWLNHLIKTEKFASAAKKFLEVEKRLKPETDYETRCYLGKSQQQLIKNF